MNCGQFDQLTSEIISAAIEVHRALGPGLLESAYEQCLCRELELRGIPFVQQQPVPVEYKGVRLECGYRLDICVAGRIVVEVKAISELLILILNFNVPLLKDGIRRIVHNYEDDGR